VAEARAVLEVDDVRRAFGGVRAVDGVSFALERGEIRALIGPTAPQVHLLRHPHRPSLRADAGRVRWRGRENRRAAAARDLAPEGFSRTFQITATFATLHRAGNVQVARLSTRAAAARLLIPAARLEWRRRARCSRRWGGRAGRAAGGGPRYGDLKKLELAIALANDPALLLLDEPTAGMAPASAAR